jgi:hypothetical protein
MGDASLKRATLEDGFAATGLLAEDSRGERRGRGEACAFLSGDMGGADIGESIPISLSKSSGFQLPMDNRKLSRRGLSESFFPGLKLCVVAGDPMSLREARDALKLPCSMSSRKAAPFNVPPSSSPTLKSKSLTLVLKLEAFDELREGLVPLDTSPKIFRPLAGESLGDISFHVV